MKDLFEIETKVTMTARASNLPKGVTTTINKVIEKVIPFAERYLEAIMKTVEED